MKRLLPLLVLTWILWSPASVQATLTPKQRLATLARVRGFLKYHDPGIARPHLDWDSVLVVSLAPVQAAQIQQDLQKEFAKLLRLLGPLPTQVNVLPAHLIARDVGVVWLQNDPALVSLCNSHWPYVKQQNRDGRFTL